MIEVLNAGLFTSIQDSGRYGYRRFGVPLSGVMHGQAAYNANILLGNDSRDALIEFTNPAPVLKFALATWIVVTGADFRLELNNTAISMNSPVYVDANSTLKIYPSSSGVWGYLAVKGGIQSEKVLGSRSYCSGITSKYRLSRGDELPVRELNTTEDVISGSVIKDYAINRTDSLKVYRGPDFHLLPDRLKSVLISNTYRISPQSNRMAYLFEHELKIGCDEIITAPVQPGTIQMTPSGKIIALMRDAQTTGGYARIFQLPEYSIDFLSQIRGNNTVSLKLISQ